MTSAAQALIAARLGLDFPLRRVHDPEPAFADAAAPVGSDAWRRLVAAVTVQESFFFRDRPVFDALVRHVVPAASRRPVRIWSAGCAEGQEPYTLAMLLGADVEILASDVDPAALERARAGVYGEWALRETPEWARQRFFRRVGKRFEIAPELRERVRFTAHNLHADPYPQGIDVLLCRNVLMYFTPDARAAAVNRLRAALSPNGWLVVAPAEASSELLAPLRPVRFEGAILYRREDAREAAGGDARVAAGGDHGRVAAAGDDARGAAARDDRLAAARAAADAGLHDQAAALCEAALAADRLDLEAHLLLAAVEREREDARAELAALRAALYLDPENRQAQLQLAALRRRR